MNRASILVAKGVLRQLAGEAGYVSGNSRAKPLLRAQASAWGQPTVGCALSTSSRLFKGQNGPSDEANNRAKQAKSWLGNMISGAEQRLDKRINQGAGSASKTKPRPKETNAASRKRDGDNPRPRNGQDPGGSSLDNNKRRRPSESLDSSRRLDSRHKYNSTSDGSAGGRKQTRDDTSQRQPRGSSSSSGSKDRTPDKGSSGSNGSNNSNNNNNNNHNSNRTGANRRNHRSMGSVRHDRQNNRFILELDNNQVARIDYKPLGASSRLTNRIEVYHTEVPEEFRGQGIGRVLARGALECASQANMKLRVTCTYLQDYISKLNADDKYRKLMID